MSIFCDYYHNCLKLLSQFLASQKAVFPICLAACLSFCLCGEQPVVFYPLRGAEAAHV